MYIELWRLGFLLFSSASRNYLTLQSPVTVKHGCVSTHRNIFSRNHTSTLFFLSFFDLKTFFLFYPKRFQLKNNIYFSFRKTIDFSMFDLIGVGIGGSGGGVYSKVYYSVVGGLNLK
jgi:hypothetical protein